MDQSRTSGSNMSSLGLSATCGTVTRDTLAQNQARTVQTGSRSNRSPARSKRVNSLGRNRLLKHRDSNRGVARALHTPRHPGKSSRTVLPRNQPRTPRIGLLLVLMVTVLLSAKGVKANLKLANILPVLGLTMLIQTVSSASAVTFNAQSKGKWYKVAHSITDNEQFSKQGFTEAELADIKLMYVNDVYEEEKKEDNEEAAPQHITIWLPALERTITVNAQDFASKCEEIEHQQLFNQFNAVRESNEQHKRDNERDNEQDQKYKKEHEALTYFLDKDSSLKIGEWVKSTNRLRIIKKNGTTNYNRSIKAAKVIGLDEEYLKEKGKARFALRIMSDDGDFYEARVLNKHVGNLTKIDQKLQSKLDKMFYDWNAADALIPKDTEHSVSHEPIKAKAQELKKKYNADVGKYNADKGDKNAENRFNGLSKDIMKKHLEAREKLLKKAHPELEGLVKVTRRRRLLTMERLLKETERAQRTA